MTDTYPKMDIGSEEKRQQDLLEGIKKNLEKNLTDQQRADLKVLGEKFHESFDVTKGTIYDVEDIQMEESLAYVVETLKSGIHPDYLNEDERAILVAGYGEKWYEKWGYESSDIKNLNS